VYNKRDDRGQKISKQSLYYERLDFTTEITREELLCSIPYTREKLLELNASLDIDEWNTDTSQMLYNTWGKRMDNLYMFDSTSVSQSIRHMKNTILFCLSRLKNYKILIIEGVGFDNVRKIRDIDVIVYNQNEDHLLFVDITSRNGVLGTEVKVKHPEKTLKLESKLPHMSHDCLVCSMGVAPKNINVVDVMITSNEYENQFAYANRLLYHSNVLLNSKEKVKEYVLSSMSQDEKIKASDFFGAKGRDTSAEEKYLSENSFEAMKWFENKDNSLMLEGRPLYPFQPLNRHDGDESVLETLKRHSDSNQQNLFLKRILLAAESELFDEKTSVLELPFCLNDWRDDLKSNEATYETAADLEEAVDSMLKTCYSTAEATPLHIKAREIIEELSDQSGISTMVSVSMRATLKRTENKLMSFYYDYQKLSQTLAFSRKLKRHVEKKGGVMKKTVKLYVSHLEGKDGLIFCTIPTRHDKDITYFITGSFLGTTAGFRHCPNGCTRLLSLSKAQVDWGCRIFSTCLSILTKCVDKNRVNKKIHQTKSLEPVLLYCNRGSFSVFSESVRHFFVGGTSFGGSSNELWDKLSEYKANNMIESLYHNRLRKMDYCLTQLKETGKLHKARKRWSSDGEDFVEWEIALPHENTPCRSNQEVYNGFYICRYLNLNRSNPITSSAEVVEKSLDARKRKLDSKGDGDYVGDIEDLEASPHSHFKRKCKEKHSGLHSPNYVLVLLAAKLRNFQIGAKGLEKEVYSSLSRMRVSDILNTRASMKDGEPSLYCETKIRKNHKKDSEVKREKTNDGRKGKEKEDSKGGTHSTDKKANSSYSYWKNNYPNSKCYKTVIQLCDKYTKRELQSRTQSLHYYLEQILQDDVCAYAYMFAKDQIGQREIAVLNARLRVVAYSIETISRSIRDYEHSKGYRENLIEIDDKDDQIQELHLNHSSKAVEEKTLHENGDCSKWGPSQVPVVMFLTLSSRLPKLTGLIHRTFSYFTHKKILLPQKLLSFFHNRPLKKGSLSIVNRLRERLLVSGDDVLDKGKQLILAAEGMFQGILGVTSSVVGTDCHFLLDWLLRKRLPDVSVSFQCTSDDFCRHANFPKKSEMSLKALMLVIEMLENQIYPCFSIKKSSPKSTFNTHVSELNSIFMSSRGVYKPEIKTRSSYVAFSDNTNAYDSAVESHDKQLEFLAEDGGLVGSYWVRLSRDLLHLKMFQMEHISVGKRFSMPLELGGLPSYDVLCSVHCGKISSLLGNYSSHDSFYELYRNFLDMANVTGLDDESIKTSHSGTTNFMLKPRRNERKLREYCDKVGAEIFEDVFSSHEIDDTVTMLLSLLQRESSTGFAQEQSDRMNIPQAPKNLKSIRFESKFHEKMKINGEHSLNDIHHLADNWSPVYSENLRGEFHELAQNKQRRYNDYQDCVDNCRLERIMPVNKMARKRKFVLRNLSNESCEMLFKEFMDNDSNFINKVSEKKYTFFDKMLKVASYTHYLRKMNFESYSLCVTHRLRTFDVVSSVLTSNFLEGSQAECSNIGSLDSCREEVAVLETVLNRSIDSFKYKQNTPSVRLTSKNKMGNSLRIESLLKQSGNNSSGSDVTDSLFRSIMKLETSQIPLSVSSFYRPSEEEWNMITLTNTSVARRIRKESGVVKQVEVIVADKKHYHHYITDYNLDAHEDGVERCDLDTYYKKKFHYGRVIIAKKHNLLCFCQGNHVLEVIGESDEPKVNEVQARMPDFGNLKDHLRLLEMTKSEKTYFEEHDMLEQALAMEDSEDDDFFSEFIQDMNDQVLKEQNERTPNEVWEDNKKKYYKEIQNWSQRRVDHEKISVMSNYLLKKHKFSFRGALSDQILKMWLPYVGPCKKKTDAEKTALEKLLDTIQQEVNKNDRALVAFMLVQILYSSGIRPYDLDEMREDNDSDDFD
jgi:hypothetical protein